MFTFDKSKNNIAVASIGNKQIYIDKSTDKIDTIKKIDSIIDGLPMVIKMDERIAIADAILQKNKSLMPTKYSGVYDLAAQLVNSGEEQIVSLEPISIVPRVIENQTDILYCIASSGDGKSTFINDYLLKYNKMFPKNNVWFFARSPVDNSINANIKRVNIDDTIISDPIDIHDLANSCVVFDDTDNISNSKLKIALHRLLLDCIANGRKLNIRTLIARHIGNNYKETREMLLEATQIIIFPNSKNHLMNTTILNKYCGFTPKETTYLLNLNTRWICIDRANGSFITTQYSIQTKNNIVEAVKRGGKKK